MVERKKSKKRSIERAPSSTRLGRQNLLIEDLTSKFNMVIDAVQDQGRLIVQTKAEILAIVDEKYSRLESAFRMNQADTQKSIEIGQQNSVEIRQLRVAVEKNSEDIQKNSEDIQKNSEDIRKNSEDILKNSADIDRLSSEVFKLNKVLKTDEEEHAIKKIERRLDRVEQHIGIGSPGSI